MEAKSETESESREDDLEDTFRLARRVQQGDADALAVLAERYYPRIRRMVAIRAGARLRAAVAVDDIVQGVLLRIIRGLDRFERRSDSQFIQWVSRIASNEIIDQDRSSWRHQGHTGGDDDLGRRIAVETRSALGRLAHLEELQLVDDCIEELKESHREILLLRDYAGASWTEIMAELGRPSVGSCQQLHQRARRDLADKLARRGLGEPE